MSRHLRMYFYIFTTRNVRVQICRNTKTKTIIPIIIFLHGNNYWNNVRCEIMSMKRERLAETAPSCGTLQKKERLARTVISQPTELQRRSHATDLCRILWRLQPDDVLMPCEGRLRSYGPFSEERSGTINTVIYSNSD